MNPLLPQVERLTARQSAKKLFTLPLWLAALLALMILPCFTETSAAQEQPKGLGLTNGFFAMDTGVHGDGLKTPQDKAKFLKQVGYAGIGWTPPGIPEMLAALAQEGLSMETLYVGVRIGDGEQKFDPQLPKFIEMLKGRGTILWLQISSKSDQPSTLEGDERAVAVIREISGLAQAAGLRVALYPHAGAWLERVQDAVRVVRKVARANVGVTFNLSHSLRVGDESKIPELLRECRPHLFVVTVNGADHAGGWNQLIQPLDQGAFDTAQFLRQLQAIHFTGPIGLQHYGVKGDARENLQRSMKAWRKLASP